MPRKRSLEPTPPARSASHPARAPSQARGERRVCAILDAAASLLETGGPAAVTVHGIARRARTSIGSFYHFFPGLEAVYLALVDRYTHAMEEAEAETAGRSAADWRRLSAAEAVEATFAPIQRLLDRHGYVMALRAIPTINAVILQREQEVGARGHEVTDRLIHARHPRMPAQRRAAVVAVFLGTLQGGFANGRHLPRRLLVPAIKRALTAQLEALAPR